MGGKNIEPKSGKKNARKKQQKLKRLRVNMHELTKEKGRIKKKKAETSCS